MTTIIRPVREILKETILNNGRIGKINIDLFRSQLPFDFNLLKGCHPLRPDNVQFLANKTIRSLKEIFENLEGHYSLAIQSTDGFEYLAVFTTQTAYKISSSGIKNFKYVTERVAEGKLNILGYGDAQYLVVNPVYQVSSEFIRLSPVRTRGGVNNVSEYWELHKEEISEILLPHLNDPSAIVNLSEWVEKAQMIL